MGNDLAGELKRLHELVESGILSEQEFEDQKAKLLAGPEKSSAAPTTSYNFSSEPEQGGAGFGIAGMVIGIMLMLMVIGAIEEGYTEDEAAGLLMFTIIGFGLSAFGLTGNRLIDRPEHGQRGISTQRDADRPRHDAARRQAAARRF